MNELKLNTFWKLILVSSIITGSFGLFALGNLDTNISGDGIPNKPQSAHKWDEVMQIIAVVVLSVITAMYSGIKFFR